MAVADLRVFLNNHVADEQRLDTFSEIRVDQAIGMATEAEVHLDLAADESGNWADIEEDFAQPFSRVRVEAKIGKGDFVELVDGPIVAQRFELSATPNRSKLVLVVHDDSVLLNQDEGVELYEDLAPHEIAELLFEQYGLTPQVDSTPSPSGGLPRFIVRRGTAMQLLRELARRHGLFVYVRPSDTPGKSIGVFARPDLTPSDFPELLLMGQDRNVNSFNGRFDGLSPLPARADSIRITDKSILTSEATSSDLEPLGDTSVHEIVTPGQSMLARTREDESDLDAATTAAVDHSSWAYSAIAETAADIYPAVLSPHKVIRVAGPGGYLGGDYLISRVAHVIDDENYKQQVTLRRNARSSGGAGGGALPTGIF